MGEIGEVSSVIVDESERLAKLMDEFLSQPAGFEG
jgi:hypothetical protein